MVRPRYLSVCLFSSVSVFVELALSHLRSSEVSCLAIISVLVVLAMAKFLSKKLLSLVIMVSRAVVEFARSSRSSTYMRHGTLVGPLVVGMLGPFVVLKSSSS